MKLRTAGAGTLQNFALYTLCGTFLYAVCAGFRDNYGIMLPYIVEWSGIPYSTLSFVIALGQLFFGLMQPFSACSRCEPQPAPYSGRAP